MKMKKGRVSVLNPVEPGVRSASAKTVRFSGFTIRNIVATHATPIQSDSRNPCHIPFGGGLRHVELTLLVLTIHLFPESTWSRNHAFRSARGGRRRSSVGGVSDKPSFQVMLGERLYPLFTVANEAASLHTQIILCPWPCGNWCVDA